MFRKGVGAVDRVFVAALLCLSGAARADRGGDVDALIRQVESIAWPGVPGPLSVVGERAFVVIAARSGRGVREPLVAAGRWGSGRVVAFGHEGYFDARNLKSRDTGRLAINCIRWAAKREGSGGKAMRVAVRGLEGLHRYLVEEGIGGSSLSGADWREKLGAFDVLCVNTNEIAGERERSAVARFVERGGGLIAASLGWGWAQLHPKRSLREEHPGNRLLAPAGIVWADGYLRGRFRGGGLRVDRRPAELCHALRALDLMERHAAREDISNEDLRQAGRILRRAVLSVPPGDERIEPRVRRLLPSVPVPAPEAPVRNPSELARLAALLELGEMKRLPPEKVRAHPAAASFPGSVPEDAARVSRSVKLEGPVDAGGSSAWLSTGLYAAPGEAISVSVPEKAVSKGLKVRIGCHTDTLWHKDSWPRFPEIAGSWTLEDASTRVASAFGGLIYIEVPDSWKGTGIRVDIAGAVEAPYFVLGATSLKDWRDRIRDEPAPWAELASSKMILSVPSRVVRQLEDPEDLMRLWVRVIDACSELAARSLEPRRPERFVCDAGISAGYMHAGYPLMAHLDVAEIIVEKNRLLKNDHGGIWGLFHEIGHNHQSRDWTFSGAGEVTVNLFTLYVYHTVFSNERPRPKLYGDSRRSMIRRYLDGGADFAAWRKDPFLALLMYMQLQEAFGWQAYKEVFAEYRRLPRIEKPRDDDDRRDQWMTRFSRAVGRNLGPFFTAWGVPTSERARESIADLPPWMPESFPP